jgi:NAD(P)-dependent dehydrogenase (short-subunit alcohol dehydrogenase family)
VKSILISGGNSGIGLQAAQELVNLGHHVMILGRDKQKCEDAAASLGSLASCFATDLSTHSGVRHAAQWVLTESDRLDAILHTTGVLTTKDIKTEDGLNLSFAVNYLSRYHLTQLLLPALRRSKAARVILVTAAVPLSAIVDLQQFPDITPFDSKRARLQNLVANAHYVAYLAKAEPGLLAAVVNAGVTRTDIYRHSPWYVRGLVTVASPLLNSLQQSAYNAVQACLRDDWPTATYWYKPGAFERRSSIVLDETYTSHIVAVSRRITGA